MAEYLGNCNHIVDWNKFINDLELIEPFMGYQTDEDRSISSDIDVLATKIAWTDAGYPMTDKTRNSPIAWEAWYSKIHFDNTIQDILCDFLNIHPVDISMVTRLIPGRFAPWHWDIRNRETIERFNSYGKPIVRIHIHISKPQPGHVFMINDHCFYNEPQGSIYKWADWRNYHAGANCGLTSKYQFSIIGVDR